MGYSRGCQGVDDDAPREPRAALLKKMTYNKLFERTYFFINSQKHRLHNYFFWSPGQRDTKKPCRYMS